MRFESMASALVLQCSILYILKNHTLAAGQSMLLSYHLKIRDLVDIESDVQTMFCSEGSIQILLNLTRIMNAMIQAIGSGICTGLGEHSSANISSPISTKTLIFGKQAFSSCPFGVFQPIPKIHNIKLL